MSTSPGELVQRKTVPFPPHEAIHGKYTSLVPLAENHADALFRHIAGPNNIDTWTFLPFECAQTLEEFKAELTKWALSKDPQYYAVLSRPASDPAAEAVGMMSFLNIVPEHRRIEIGWVVLGHALRRTCQATEAFYLMQKRAFDDLGYERVEWKTDSYNAASRAAAARLLFHFEGIFRKHNVVKGRRRDTAWFSVIDTEWATSKKGFVTWLDEDNFDENGKQKKTLAACREQAT